MELIRNYWGKSTRSLMPLLFLLLIVFVCFNLWTTVNSIKTSPISESHPHITQKFSYFIDEPQNQSVQQLASRLDKFTVATPDEIPFDLGNQVYWVFINLNNKNSEPTELVLHIDNAMLVDSVVYDFDGLIEDSTKEIQTETIVGDVFPSVNLNLLANERRSFMLKLKAAGPPKIPLVFYEVSNFQNKTTYSFVLYGAFIAVILLMALYNLVLFAAIKDIVYLFYIGYLLSSLVVLGSVIGFGYLVFPINIQVFINQHSLFFHYYLVLFLLLFSLYFLRYDVKKASLYWLSIFFSAVLIILSVASLWFSHEYQAKLFFGLQPFFYLMTLVLVIKRINRSYTWARFYFISWIPLLIGAAVQPLMLLNQLDYSFLNRNAFMIAVLIEVIFMAFALAERMRRFEVERVREVSYHPNTNIPRKVLIENAINSLSQSQDNNFSILVIEPEQIDRISLYVDDEQKNKLLKRLSNKLSRLFEFNDAVVTLSDKEEKVCLLSGNRFAILVDHKRSNQALNVLVHSIQQMVEEDYKLDDLKLPLSAVVGVANCPEHGQSGSVLLNRAQLAIAHAKVDHQHWSYFEESKSDKTSYYLALASDMKEGIENGEFELYHQPQIDLKTLNVCGSEVLLRWNHEQQGFIPPDVFIPIAEDMGLINRLTQWVMRQAIDQQLVLFENGYNHMISINISGKDLAAQGFYAFVVELLNNSELPASKIALELTESSSIANSKRAVAVVEKLAELGLTISIDDFGTGYSSMAYINALPFQELKVDRQFVENVCADKRRKVIAETTVRMAKGLGFEVVAEGINSKLDEETLKGFGCDIGQGYYYAKPMPLEEYLVWLAKEVNGQVSQTVINELDGEFIPKST